MQYMDHLKKIRLGFSIRIREYLFNATTASNVCFGHYNLRYFEKLRKHLYGRVSKGGKTGSALKCMR